MDFSFFVITLKRTPDRLQGFRANNAGTDIAFEHFEAIDCATLDSSTRAVLVSPHATDYTPGTLGNTASYRALWLRCCEQQNPLVICEDDAVLRGDIADQLPTLLSRADDWDIIMLGFNFDEALEVEIAPGILMGWWIFCKISELTALACVHSRPRPGRIAASESMLRRLRLCDLADGASPPSAKGFSDGQQTDGHKVSQPQLSRLRRRLHDRNALSRTRRICVHRPAGNDPERPENLVDAEMTVSNQSRSANFRRYANQRGAPALRRHTELDLRGTR